MFYKFLPEMRTSDLNAYKNNFSKTILLLFMLCFKKIHEDRFKILQSLIGFQIVGVRASVYSLSL